MTAQQLMQDSRLVRVRALQNEVARLKTELAQVRAQQESLRHHFAEALLAARDAEELGPDGVLLIVDGWNALLGSVRFPSRDALRQTVNTWLAAHPENRAWIVFDGSEASGGREGRLRVSYTGGTGAHRADRMVCDYLRMRCYAGAPGRVCVMTEDQDFRAEAERLGADTTGVKEWKNGAVP